VDVGNPETGSDSSFLSLVTRDGRWYFKVTFFHGAGSFRDQLQSMGGRLLFVAFEPLCGHTIGSISLNPYLSFL